VVPKTGTRNAASARQALLLSVIPEYLLAGRGRRDGGDVKTSPQLAARDVGRSHAHYDKTVGAFRK
jgi:hypothetical protein